MRTTPSRPVTPPLQKPVTEAGPDKNITAGSTEPTNHNQDPRAATQSSTFGTSNVAVPARAPDAGRNRFNHMIAPERNSLNTNPDIINLKTRLAFVQRMISEHQSKGRVSLVERFS